jgi:hypothetical protein
LELHLIDKVFKHAITQLRLHFVASIENEQASQFNLCGMGNLNLNSVLLLAGFSSMHSPFICVLL